MVTYNVTVTADGYPSVDLGDQLNSLSLTTGSSDGIEQSNPSTLALSFYGTPSQGSTTYSAAWWLGKAITVVIKPSDTAADDYISWRGFVTSANARAEDAAGTVMLVDLTAYSRMSLLGNELVNLPAGDQTINARVTSIYNDSVAIKWNELNGTTNWYGYSNTVTWANFDSTRPSVYFAAKTTGTSPMSDLMSTWAMGEVDGITALQQTAMAVNGFLYEAKKVTGTGGSTTQCYLSWWQSPGTNPTFDLSNVMIGQGLEVSLDTSRLVTEFTFDWIYDPTPSVDTRVVGDTAAQQAYGYRPQTVTLYNYSYSELEANWLYKYSRPFTNLSRLTLLVDAIPAANKTDMMFGSFARYYFTGLPAAFGGDQNMEVRGATLTLSYETATVDLVVVPDSFWSDIMSWYEAVGAWNAFATSTTKWSEVV